jgi:hypothetical protein
VAATPSRKVTLLPRLPFTNSEAPAMACVNTTISMGQGLNVFGPLHLFRKLIRHPALFGSMAATPRLATATTIHFHPNSGLIFLTDEMANGKQLVDTGATLSICASQIQQL